MDLNLLNPVRAVQGAIDKPDSTTAFVLVLLPVFVSIAGSLALGVPLNFFGLAFSAIVSVVSWVVLSACLYIIGFLVEGKYLKGKMSGILSAVSLLWLVFAIMSVVGIIAVAVVVPQDTIRTIVSLQNGTIGENEAYTKISEQLDSAASGTSVLLMGFFTVVGTALVAFALLLVFVIARELSPKSLGKQIAIFALFLAAWLALSLVASAVAP